MIILVKDKTIVQEEIMISFFSITDINLIILIDIIIVIKLNLNILTCFYYEPF